MRNFLDAIARIAPQVYTIQDAMAVLAVIAAVYESAQYGRTVVYREPTVERGENE